MAAIRGSSVPIAIKVTGVNLTAATEITFVLAWRVGDSPFLTKTKSGTAITVTYDGTTGTSTLSLTLLDTETAAYTQDVAFTIYINDGTAGGDWIPDNGGVGIIKFAQGVKKV